MFKKKNRKLSKKEKAILATIESIIFAIMFYSMFLIRYTIFASVILGVCIILIFLVTAWEDSWKE